MIYDNSPTPSGVSGLGHAHYVSNPLNGGIFAAYDYAFRFAKSAGYSWLLTLDEDSELPPNFLQLSIPHLELASKDDSIAAVVPQLVCGSTPISPSRIMPGHILRPLGRRYGIQNRPITALGSGSFVRRSFVENIGGFNELFQLDYQDHWLFHEIYNRAHRVYVTDVRVSHDLSITNYATVSMGRYRSILHAELRFYRLFQRRTDRLIYLCRLIMRIFKQMRLSDRAHAKETFAHLLRSAASVIE